VELPRVEIDDGRLAFPVDRPDGELVQPARRKPEVAAAGDRQIPAAQAQRCDRELPEAVLQARCEPPCVRDAVPVMQGERKNTGIITDSMVLENVEGPQGLPRD